MSELGEMARHYNEIRERLMSPPNAIPDKGINLHPNRIPPKPPLVIHKPAVLENSITSCKVTIRIVPAPPTEPTIPRIIKLSSINRAVCRHFSVSMAQIKDTSRKPRFVLPRHIICYLAWLHTGMSMPQIARKINRKDHTSILHARNKIREMLLVEESLAETIKLLEYALFAGYYDTDESIFPPCQTGDDNGKDI